MKRISLLASMALSALIATAAVATYRVLADPKVVVVRLQQAAPPPPECPEPPPRVVEVPIDRGSPVQIGSQPFADVIIDGKRQGSTPLYGPNAVWLLEGEHEVELFDRTTMMNYHYLLDVKQADPTNKVIVLLGKRQAPRTFGSVTVELIKAVAVTSDERAAILFEDAVDALRDRNNERGCTLLEEICDRAPADSVWKSKAEKLFARRCD